MRNDKIIKIGIVIVAAILIFIGYEIIITLIEDSQQVDISGNEFYQYFGGIRFDYSGKMEILNYQNISRILLLEDGSKVYLDSTPLYYKNETKRIFLPSEMELVNPIEKKYSKLKENTVVYIENNNINIKKYNSKKSSTVSDAFLFNGNDMYLFLEETIIKFKDKEYVVSPLSYANVSYRDYIEIFDYEKDEFIVDRELKKDEDIIAYNDLYTINMSLDSLTCNDVQQLLITKLDYIPEYEY